MARPGGARARLLAAAALLCLCCWAAGPAAAQPTPKVAVAKPASAAVELEQAAAGQTAAAEQQALEQAKLIGATGEEQQQPGGSDQQAADQGSSGAEQSSSGGAGQLTEEQLAASLDPTAEQLQQEAAATASPADEQSAPDELGAQPEEQPAAGAAAAAAGSDPEGVVVLVVYKQPGAGLTEDQAIAKATANSASLREFVRRLTGGLGAPALPLQSISFLGAQAFDPESMPGVTDTGCDGVAGTWVQANVRVNTPDASAAYQNISTALDSDAATATEARWNATAGQLTGGAKPPAPCFGRNFTSFQYTPASMPPPAPPSPSPKPPSSVPTMSEAPSPPAPLPPEEASPSPAGPWFPTTDGTGMPGGSSSSGMDSSSSGMDSSGGDSYGSSDTPGAADGSGGGGGGGGGSSSTAATGGSAGNPAYGSSPTPVYTSPSLETFSPPAVGSSPAIDGTGTVVGPGGGIGGGSPGLNGGSPGLNGGSPSLNGGSPAVNSPAVASPVPGSGTGSPPANPYAPALSPPAAYAPPATYVPSTPYLNGDSGAALAPGEDPFGSLSPGAMAPSAAPAMVAQCTAEPTCKLFVTNALCCKQRGSVASGSTLRVWLVCNRDVYLPETKCLTATNTASKVAFPAMDPLYADPLNTVNVTVLDRPNARAAEYAVGLPLAFFVPPLSNAPGRLSVRLDFEEKRMEESDGTCSLRLREPCEWDGKLYAAVVPVDTLPVLSVMTEADTTSAYTQVQTYLAEARKQAEQAAAAYGDDGSGSVSTSSIGTRRSLLESAAGLRRRLDSLLPLGRQLQAEKKNTTDKPAAKKQETDKKAEADKPADKKAGGDAADKKKADGGAADQKAEDKVAAKSTDKKTADSKVAAKSTDKKTTDGKKKTTDGKKADDGKKKTDDKKKGDDKKPGTKKDDGKVAKKEVPPSSSGGLNVVTSGDAVGGDLPAPSVDAAALPPLTDVLAANYTSDVNLEGFSVSWLPLQTGAGKPACQSAATADLPESFLLGDFQGLKGAEQECGDSQLGMDLPSVAELTRSGGQDPATSGACRRFSLF